MHLVYFVSHSSKWKVSGRSKSEKKFKEASKGVNIFTGNGNIAHYFIVCVKHSFRITMFAIFRDSKFTADFISKCTLCCPLTACAEWNVRGLYVSDESSVSSDQRSVHGTVDRLCYGRETTFATPAPVHGCFLIPGCIRNCKKKTNEALFGQRFLYGERYMYKQFISITLCEQLLYGQR